MAVWQTWTQRSQRGCSWPEPQVAQVVDINPPKQGKFLPVTGHEVIGPAALASAPPDTVIVMNPIYLPEIAADLATLGLAPELVAI